MESPQWRAILTPGRRFLLESETTELRLILRGVNFVASMRQAWAVDPPDLNLSA